MKDFVILGSILAANILTAIILAWRSGVHLAKKHDGDWEANCNHWACLCNGGGIAYGAAVILGPIVFLILALLLTIQFLVKHLNKINRAPYLRKMPPQNQHPTAKEKSEYEVHEDSPW